MDHLQAETVDEQKVTVRPHTASLKASAAVQLSSLFFWMLRHHWVSDAQCLQTVPHLQASMSDNSS
jgi:hypothetical protein